MSAVEVEEIELLELELLELLELELLELELLELLEEDAIDEVRDWVVELEAELAGATRGSAGGCGNAGGKGVPIRAFFTPNVDICASPHRETMSIKSCREFCVNF